MHELQNADSKLVTKNGSQQAINTPITMPNVLKKKQNKKNISLSEKRIVIILSSDGTSLIQCPLPPSFDTTQ